MHRNGPWKLQDRDGMRCTCSMGGSKPASRLLCNSGSKGSSTQNLAAAAVGGLWVLWSLCRNGDICSMADCSPCTWTHQRASTGRHQLCGQSACTMGKFNRQTKGKEVVGSVYMPVQVSLKLCLASYLMCQMLLECLSTGTFILEHLDIICTVTGGLEATNRACDRMSSKCSDCS